MRSSNPYSECVGARAARVTAGAVGFIARAVGVATRLACGSKRTASFAARLTGWMLIALLPLSAGCVDAVREGAVGGLGNAVEGVVEQAVNLWLFPWQSILLGQ